MTSRPKAVRPVALRAKIAGGFGPVVGVGPGERHIADAQRVVATQEVERVLDGVAAFDAHAGRRICPPRARPECPLARCIERAEQDAGGLARGRRRSAPESGGRSGLARRWVRARWRRIRQRDCRVCAVSRLSMPAREREAGEIPGLVDKTLRRVGVGVDDQCGGVNLGGVGGEVGVAVMRDRSWRMRSLQFSWLKVQEMATWGWCRPMVDARLPRSWATEQPIVEVGPPMRQR